MRTARLLGITGGLGWVLTGLVFVSACNESAPPPRYNTNLGDKPGELMPVSVSPADPGILQDQKGVTEEEFVAPADRAAKGPAAARGAQSRDGEQAGAPGTASDNPADAKAKSLEALMNKAKQKDDDAKTPPAAKAATPKKASAAKATAPPAKKPAAAKAKPKTSPDKSTAKKTPTAAKAKPKPAPKKPTLKKAPAKKAPAKSAPKKAPAKSAPKKSKPKPAKKAPAQKNNSRVPEF